MKRLFYLLILSITFWRCNGVEKREVLVAKIQQINDHSHLKFEFILYGDSSYSFVVDEYSKSRHKNNEEYYGRYLQISDTIKFSRLNFPALSECQTAILRNNYIEFLGGKRPLKMKIIRTTTPNLQRIDTTRFPKYSTFTYDSSFYQEFEKGSIAYDLNNSDLQIIEDILKTISSEGEKQLDLSTYIKQCVAVKNLKGEREVWINLLCDSDDRDAAQYYVIRVSDGGSCYLNLKINIDRKNYYDAYINGEG